MARSYDIAILSQKVEYLESAGIELPKVTSSDNGKVLQVVSGKWKKGSKMPDAVSANPEGEIANELTGIQIGDEKYKITQSPRIVVSIEANEYSTYALALAEVKTAFDELTDDEKRRSKLIIGNFILTFVKPNDSSFSALTVATDTIAMRSAYLNSGGAQFYLEAGISAQSVTFSNQSANVQAQAITLIC